MQFWTPQFLRPQTAFYKDAAARSSFPKPILPEIGSNQAQPVNSHTRLLVKLHPCARRPSFTETASVNEIAKRWTETREQVAAEGQAIFIVDFEP